MALTVAEARNAKPRENQYKLGDEKGLYLLVKPNDTKAWRHKYRFGDKEKLASYGLFPEVGLAEARDRRDAARALLRAGKDPIAQAERDRQTAIAAAGAVFKPVALAWHDDEKARWSPQYSRVVLNALTRDVFPEIGKRPVAEIEARDILAMLRKIERRGAIETAKRVKGYVYEVFKRAKGEHLIAVNPVTDDIGDALKPTPRGAKQPALTTLPALLKLQRQVDASTSGPTVKIASRLLALTAVRIGVLRTGRWDELHGIDWDEPDSPSPDAVWRISAERMKLDLDDKGDEAFDHDVPLTEPAVELLRALRLLTGRIPLLFPNERTTRLPMTDSALSTLYKRLDGGAYRGKHVPHGWRSSFSTIMNEWTIDHGREGDRMVIDLMLAHRPQGMSGSEFAYNRARYSRRRRELAQVWSDMIAAGLRPAFELVRGQER